MVFGECPVMASLESTQTGRISMSYFRIILDISVWFIAVSGRSNRLCHFFTELQTLEIFLCGAWIHFGHIQPFHNCFTSLHSWTVIAEWLFENPGSQNHCVQSLLFLQAFTGAELKFGVVPDSMRRSVEYLRPSRRFTEGLGHFRLFMCACRFSFVVGFNFDCMKALIF